MRKLTTVLAICALAPFAFAACGDDDDEEEPTTQAPTEEPAGGGGGKTVAISAAPDNSFAFEVDSLEAPATDPVTFEFDNPASLGHDFCIEDSQGTEIGCTDVISESSDTLDAQLAEGEYTFFCSVSGHREGGMEGTLTVSGPGPG